MSFMPLRTGLFAQYSKSVSDLFYSGDPLMREMFLVRNDFLPLIISISYVIVILTGMRLMKKREPFDLRKPLIIFNFSLVAIYVICLMIFFIYIPTIPWELFCKGGVVRKTDPAYFLFNLGWFAYLVKYVEYMDTVFFVLRKKYNLLTFLHIFHHAIVPLVAWMLLRTEKSAIMLIPCILNCLIHVFMYTYYGLAAMGPKARKYLWWKKYLTQVQIVQFLFMLFYVIVIAPLSGCSVVMPSYMLSYVLPPLFFFLFYRYYQMAFQPIPQKSE